MTAKVWTIKCRLPASGQQMYLAAPDEVFSLVAVDDVEEGIYDGTISCFENSNEAERYLRELLDEYPRMKDLAPFVIECQECTVREP